MPDAHLIDPLGRLIVLHDRTWYGHIIQGHPEMEFHRQQIEATITNPAEIKLSLSDHSCRQYYSQPNERGVRYLVIADIDLALVKTAHFVKKLKGGTVEWLLQTP